jgi:hypothetical protein
MATRSISSISEFIDVVQEFSHLDDVLFRGQRRADWALVPSVSRLDPRHDGQDLRDVESRLIEAFRRQSAPYVIRDFPDEWEMLAMAQHHGLATRLLDWTANPLAALWFAVKDPPIERYPASVLMFSLVEEDHVEDRDATSPFGIVRTKFFQPSHLDARIVAQAGWFSVHHWVQRRTAFARLDHLRDCKDRIERITIRPKYFADLRFHLDRLGINNATLFPDVDGLARHLNWRHTLASDEG